MANTTIPMKGPVNPQGIPGVLSLDPTYEADDDGSRSFTVTRSVGTFGEVEVNWGINGLNPGDVTPQNGTLTFGNGVNSADIFTTIADLTANATAEILISSPTNGAVLGNNSAILTITDVAVNYGVLSLEPSYSIEDNRQVSFSVNRTGGTDGIVSCNWTISGPNANDFNQQSGQISFSDGQSSNSIVLTVGDLSSNGSAQLDIDTPIGGATINPSADTAPITITDSVTSQVFFDGFESGSFGPEWSTVPVAEVITSSQGPVNAGTYAAHIPYSGTTSSGQGFDQNRQITINLQSENLFNFSVAVDCYFASPNVVAARDDTIRKYFFLWSKASNNWAIIPGAPYGPATYNSIIWTTMQRYNPPFNDGYTNQPVRNSNFGVISTDQWFNLELRIQVSDAGVANGWWQTLVNGVVVSELDNVNFNNSLKSPVGRIQIGTQYDMPAGSVVSWDEDRYFDNVRVTKNVSKA